MTMFNITDGNNNVSRDKPVEHIDMVIGLTNLQRYALTPSVGCFRARLQK